MAPTFFATPADFHAWLAKLHATATELLVGFYKKGSGHPSITWPESVDEALCYGWIDGIRRGVDAVSYVIRFTPRKTNSVWSTVNVARVQALTDLGRMQPTGLKAFEARKEGKSGIYSHEQGGMDMPEPYKEMLRKHATAWEFFQKQPASYRKAVSWWIAGARKDDTRQRRLDKLLSHSARMERVPQFTSKKSQG